MNYYLSNFVILDLLSQAQAIAKYVRGWEKNRILSWIEQRGALTSKRDIFGNKYYIFTSNIGLEAESRGNYSGGETPPHPELFKTAGFYLNEDKFIFILDHTTYIPCFDFSDTLGNMP